jgi:glycosyltransferase involved in cell wall biosynthesis
MPRVSIITPAYNQAAFLDETVKSVLGQDYPNIEYIVLDDGSTDTTGEVIQPYWGRLRYFRHDNMGESRTVNKGYRMSSGDIVGVVNSDDPLYVRDAVTRIVGCFKDYPKALAVYPDWVSIDAMGKVIEEYAQPEFSIHNMLMDFKVTLGPGMFIKRSALEMLGFRNENLKFTGDLDISFRLALAGDLAHVPAFLATHREHLNAASASAKGDVMAQEVLRLAQSSLASPLLPISLLHKRRKILARAHICASGYCGRNSSLKRQYMYNALFLDPSIVLTHCFLQIRQACGRVFRKLWPHRFGLPEK